MVNSHGVSTLVFSAQSEISSIHSSNHHPGPHAEVFFTAGGLGRRHTMHVHATRVTNVRFIQASSRGSGCLKVSSEGTGQKKYKKTHPLCCSRSACKLILQRKGHRCLAPTQSTKNCWGTYCTNVMSSSSFSLASRPPMSMM